MTERKTRIGWVPYTTPEEDMIETRTIVAKFATIRDWVWYSPEEKKAAAELADLYWKEDWRVLRDNKDKIRDLLADVEDVMKEQG